MSNPNGRIPAPFAKSARLAGALALLATLFIGVSLAAADKGVVTYFGNESGTTAADGGLNQPRDIAVNSTGAGDAEAGDIYVANANNNRIEVYGSDYEFKFNFGSNGTAAGNLAAPSGVAIDQSDGSVYVREQGNRRVSKFSADGTFLFAFGAGVADDPASGPQTDALQTCTTACFIGLNSSADGGFGTSSATPTLQVIPQGAPNAGDLIVTDPGAAANRRIQRISAPGTSGPATFEDSVGGSQGSGDTQFGNNSPNRVAIDDAGRVYVVDPGNSRVQRFDSSLDFDTSFAASELSGSPAPTDIAIDPGAVSAGDATDDTVYVTKPCNATLCPGASPASERRIKELDTTGALTGTDMAGAGITSVNGIGLDTAADRLFVSSTTGGHRVYALDETVAPEATLNPISTFDAHSATFTGSVDANGALTGYRFEYVDDATFQSTGFDNATKVPTSDASVGHGDGTVAVSQDVIHLDAATTYHVRLVAKQSYGAQADIGGPLTFTTDAIPPTISGTGASVDTDTATLRAAINPENDATTYHFEWGTDDDYGNDTPTQSIPAGTSPVAVSAELSDLDPGATYHFRIVATNGTDTANGPDRTFTTLASEPELGPERAYEVVTQLPTGGIPFIDAGNAAVSINGDAVNFGSFPLPGSELRPPEDQKRTNWRYVSERGSSGWATRETGMGSQSGFGTGGVMSADASTYGLPTPQGLDPDDQNGATDLYVREPDGSLTWISRDARIPVGTPQTNATGSADGASSLYMSTASADGKTIVFSSQRQLVDDDTTPGTVWRLYKWRDGDLEFIGERPDGSVPGRGSSLGSPGMLAGYSPDPGSAISQYSVSTDGSRVVFSGRRYEQGAGDGTSLYVQSDGEPTHEAVKETGVPELPAAEPFRVGYRGASSDASRVFFTTASRMTADSGAEGVNNGDVDLYVYDLSADKVRDLTPRLDGLDNADAAPAATRDRARVLGVAATSTDGKRVYFVADGRLDAVPSPTGELPSASGRNLYRADLDGIDDPINVRFIAALGLGDDRVWSENSGGKTAYASPDGGVLGFGSAQNLVPGVDTGGARQVFVYDAGSETLDCASCPRDGSPASGPANGENDDIPGAAAVFDWQWPQSYKRWVSESGAVYFDTTTALTSADRNNVYDVYEYRGGKLRLVSSGKGTARSRFQGASADGSTVVFSTSDALVAQDDEPGVPKLYAARVDGGFPPPHAPAPPCSGDGCRDEQPDPPATEDPGSGSYEGSGNAGSGKKARACKKADRKATSGAQRVKRVRHRQRRLLERLQQRKRHASGKRAKRLGRKLRVDRKQSQSKVRKARRKARELKRAALRCEDGEDK